MKTPSTPSVLNKDIDPEDEQVTRLFSLRQPSITKAGLRTRYSRGG